MRKYWRGTRHKALVQGTGTTGTHHIRRAAVTALAVCCVLGLSTTSWGQAFDLGDHDFSGANWLHAGTTQCDPCHSGPNWNHTPSTVTGYTVTTTTLSLVGDPTSVSSECLDCHDGTVRLDAYGGQVGTGTGQSNGDVMGTGPKNFGTDLTIHHPVSFTYDTVLATAHGVLHDPATTTSGLGGTIAQDMLVNGQLECTSCHDQHRVGTNDGLLKGTPAIPVALCNTCHFAPTTEPVGTHHIPGRDDPWGAFKCTLCHGSDLSGTAGGGFAQGCAQKCHQPFSQGQPVPTGHHGGDRYDPLSNCSSCHGADLSGGSFDLGGGTTLTTPSCNNLSTGCHTAAVYTGVPAVITGGPYTGFYDEAVAFDASGTTDDGGAANLSYQWVFGDGSDPVFPSKGNATASHTYAFDPLLDDGNAANGEYPFTYTGHLTVTDGVTNPVVKAFTVTIDKPPQDPGANADTWSITVPSSTPPKFDLTIDKKIPSGSDGVFVAVKDDGTTTSLGLGIEFVGVIFWMDVNLDTTGSVLWSTGASYFGNINRTAGTMSGVVFSADGLTVDSFSGVTGLSN